MARWLPVWEQGLETEGKERDVIRAQMLLDWNFTVFWNVLSRHPRDVQTLLGEEAYTAVMDKMHTESLQFVDMIRQVDELLQ